MPITDILTKNAVEFPDDVALVEVIPNDDGAKNRVTWKDYSLIERGTVDSLRSEMTWKEFDQKANRFANLLLSRGVKKGDKIAILLMNCLEW
ncbi:MAG: AMP-binding protein, partial [Clostridia bacterium]|nr:AMP-binding protein [Clostridia bacterium]